MKKLTVPLQERSYDILIRQGLLSDLAEEAVALIPEGEQVVLISDERVWGLYGDGVIASFQAVGKRPKRILIPAGEASKSLGQLGRLYEEFAEAGLSRQGLIVALGGGVTGDLAGFAAATWMRGVRFLQVPTTLLAQVDSSVGGKTAVDIAAGKNLVGAFHQPVRVLIDPLLLGTLPEREYAAGMAEVIKYGAIAAPALLKQLESGTAADMSAVILECCRIKRDVVAKDERDSGPRMLLNFGHTFGHAIETRDGFARCNHGEGVAIGMVLAAELGQRLGVTAPGTAERLASLLSSFGLPTHAEGRPADLIPLIRRDKKAGGTGVNLVLLREIGEAFVLFVTYERLAAVLGGLEEEGAGGVATKTPPSVTAKTPKILRRFPAGIVTPPPSKSLSHRAVVCAALAGGMEAVHALKNLGDSEDIRATMKGIESILSGGSEAIDCGESGSTIRFLIPIAGLQAREWVFTGRGRLMERPLEIYREIFERNGGLFRQEGDKLHLRGPLLPGRYQIPGDVSSQFVSGLLMALPLAVGDSELIINPPLESADYARLTTAVMSAFGVGAEERRNEEGGIVGYVVQGGQRYRQGDFTVEGDFTQAANFLAAGALGCAVSVSGLNLDSLQGDRRIIDILREMGAIVTVTDGLCRARPGSAGLRAIELDVSHIPDLVPPIAALACYCKGQSRIYGGRRLRIKESDRLKALATELRKLGGEIRETAGGLIIEGKDRLAGGQVESWNDHRIAMAIAVAAIGCEGPVTVTGWEHVSKSYSQFWDDFEKAEREEVR